MFCFIFIFKIFLLTKNTKKCGQSFPNFSYVSIVFCFVRNKLFIHFLVDINSCLANKKVCVALQADLEQGDRRVFVPVWVLYQIFVVNLFDSYDFDSQHTA